MFLLLLLLCTQSLGAFVKYPQGLVPKELATKQYQLIHNISELSEDIDFTNTTSLEQMLYLPFNIFMPAAVSTLEDYFGYYMVDGLVFKGDKFMYAFAKRSFLSDKYDETMTINSEYTYYERYHDDLFITNFYNNSYDDMTLTDSHYPNAYCFAIVTGDLATQCTKIPRCIGYIESKQCLLSDSRHYTDSTLHGTAFRQKRIGRTTVTWYIIVGLCVGLGITKLVEAFF